MHATLSSTVLLALALIIAPFSAPVFSADAVPSTPTSPATPSTPTTPSLERRSFFGGGHGHGGHHASSHIDVIHHVPSHHHHVVRTHHHHVPAHHGAHILMKRSEESANVDETAESPALERRSLWDRIANHHDRKHHAHDPHHAHNNRHPGSGAVNGFGHGGWREGMHGGMHGGSMHRGALGHGRYGAYGGAHHGVVAAVPHTTTHFDAVMLRKRALSIDTASANLVDAEKKAPALQRRGTFSAYGPPMGHGGHHDIVVHHPVHHHHRRHHHHHQHYPARHHGSLYRRSDNEATLATGTTSAALGSKTTTLGGSKPSTTPRLERRQMGTGTRFAFPNSWGAGARSHIPTPMVGAHNPMLTANTHNNGAWGQNGWGAWGGNAHNGMAAGGHNSAILNPGHAMGGHTTLGSDNNHDGIHTDADHHTRHHHHSRHASYNRGH